MPSKIKLEKRYRRHKRIRAKIYGTAGCPRLCVFRSAKHIYAQLINDEKGITLAAASDLELKDKKKERKRGAGVKKVIMAREVGRLIAQKGLAKKVEKVVFDRGGSKYQGRLKALADGAREGGLKF